MTMRLYSYWRSSSAWRVRTALELKRLAYDTIPIDIAPEASAQLDESFAEVSPMQQVPVLEWRDGGETRRLGQSMAIIEYLEELVPEPALLPADPWLRGRARQIAETINAGTQPLQNGAVLRRLSGHGVDSRAWAAHFIGRGLHAVERLVSDTAGRFCIGDGPSLADIYVVPQLFNARLYGVSFDGLERLLAIETACMQLEAFQAAHPDQQPDAPARG